MILHCPSCSARYDVPAEAAANPAVTFRCTNCETMFGPAEGLSVPEDRPWSASRSTEGHLPPSRGLGQATEGVATFHGPGAVGPRGLPPTNLPSMGPGGAVSSYAQAPGSPPSGYGQPPSAVPLGVGQPPQPASVPLQNVPGGGGLPGGFRDGVFESQATVAMTGTEKVPRKMDELPVSRGVRFDSQAARAVQSSSSSEMALPAPGVPVQPIDAEAFFDDDDPGVDSNDTGGGFERARTGLRGGLQRSETPSTELATNPGLSGFGVPALGDLGGPADAQARQTVPAGHDHAAAAFAGASAMRANPNNAATVAAPAASPFSASASGPSMPPTHQGTAGPPGAAGAGPPTSGADAAFTAPPVIPSGVFGVASNPTDVHPALDSTDVRIPSEAHPSTDTGPSAPRSDTGLWGTDESKVIALPDVPTPTSFDSNELDAVPARQPLPSGVPSPKSTTGGIRRISPPTSRSASSSAALPSGPAPSFETGPASTIGRSFPDTGAVPAQSEGGSTVFRLSELDGGSGMDLDPALSATVRRSHTADVDISPKRVSQKIDPLVEFHDVFQDIRRAEKGDDRSATERYFDTGLFSGVQEQTPESEEKVRLEREARDAKLREGRLNLKAGAGGIAQRIEREVGPSDSSVEEDDDMLAAALAESGLREPSTDVAAVQEEAGRAAVVDLDVAGESAGSPAFPNAARYLTVLLVFLLATAGLLGFVASKNNGILDFGAFDQMLGVAFKGETYVPRHQSVVQIIQSAEGWVEEPLDCLPSNDGNALAVADLVGGQYEAVHGTVFTLVDGTVTNTTDRAYRSIDVEVSLTTESGDTVAVRVIPAGARIEQPLLAEIVEPGRLQSEYDRLGGLVSEVELAPESVTTFSAAFILPDDVRAADLTSTARVVGAERAHESCWGEVRFSTPDQGATALEE